MGALLRRFRWIHAAPLLAFVALAAWGFASPIGAAPDDDFHLVSTWCAVGGSAECEPGTSPTGRTVDGGFRALTCFVQGGDASAACQAELFTTPGSFETPRGNFTGEYPPIYYAVMHGLAGPDIQISALAMRLVNAALFVALTTALYVLLSGTRRRTLLWGWLVAVVPLGIFLIPSNNPSGWAVTGVGTAFLALLGWFEGEGRRRWAFGALYLVGVIMAAGARGDAGVYIVGATVTASIITYGRVPEWGIRAIHGGVGIAIALLLSLNAGQSVAAAIGFSGGASTDTPGLALAADNLLMLPQLWTGVWGTWGLGWLDTVLPAIVPASAIAAFVAVAFVGIGSLDWRKAVGISGVLLVLVVLPVYVLTVGGMRVGEAVQPRYLLPLILLLSLLLAIAPPGRELRFGRVQALAIVGALAVANLVALHVNLRRYVTGADRPSIDLDTGAEWWWSGFPVGPTVVWIVGALAFTGLLAVLWPQLRSAAVAADRESAVTRP